MIQVKMNFCCEKCGGRRGDLDLVMEDLIVVRCESCREWERITPTNLTCDTAIELKEVRIQPHQIDMRLGGEGAQVFLQLLVGLFEQNGGENFLTMTVGNQEKKYSITIQNHAGEDTPAEKINRLEERLSRLENEKEGVK